MHRAFKDRPLMEPFDIARIRLCLFPRGSVRCSFFECCRVVWCDYLHCVLSALREKGK